MLGTTMLLTAVSLTRDSDVHIGNQLLVNTWYMTTKPVTAIVNKELIHDSPPTTPTPFLLDIWRSRIVAHAICSAFMRAGFFSTRWNQNQQLKRINMNTIVSFININFNFCYLLFNFILFTACADWILFLLLRIRAIKVFYVRPSHSK